MENIKKLPIGIQSFEEVSRDCIYIDKTKFIYNIIKYGKNYFLSRPRRFGKSLFIDTLKEVFESNKELFKNYYIYNSDYDWQKYNVIRIDFSGIDSRSNFKENLKQKLCSQFNNFEINTYNIQSILTSLILPNSVVLIDEYDSPIINNINNLEVAEENKEVLKDFFTTIKSLDANLKFVFVTGISRFSKTSLFSGMNNLNDITMDDKSSDMFGYTENEIRNNFADYIEKISKTWSVSYDDVFDKMKDWYNGYKFSRNGVKVYNPFSTLLFFDNKEINNYWYSSGTPTFLINLLKKQNEPIQDFSNSVAVQYKLADISNLEKIDVITLMFQTGYLTVNYYDDESNLYHLCFPNKEVAQSLSQSLISDVTNIHLETLLISKIKFDLQNKDYESFFSKLKTFFAKIPYNLFHKSEKSYHAIMLTIFHASNMNVVRSEDMTNIGRLDIVVETDKNINIFEVKLNKSANEALEQIKIKKYYEKYLYMNKEIVTIGVNFSSEERNVSEWNFNDQNKEKLV